MTIKEHDGPGACEKMHHCWIIADRLSVIYNNWNLDIKAITVLVCQIELKHSFNFVALFPLTHSFALQCAAFLILGILKSPNQFLPLCCQWVEALWVQLRYMARKERREGKVGEGMKRGWGWGNTLAKEQKAGLMITWDLEMGTRRTEDFISLLIQSPFLPWPPLSFLASPLFSVLSLARTFSTLLRQVLVVFHVESAAGND